MTTRISKAITIALAVAASVTIACGGYSTEPSGSVVAGMLKVTSTGPTDTTKTPDTGPGYFHGTVLGPSAPGSGNDTLATAPRIAGVVVTIYPGGPNSSGTIETGPSAGSVQTGADGIFTLPTLPAGQYVVTFVPPESSGYRSVYAFGPLHSKSSDYPWWVVLSKK